jgi:hypothetical protein
VDAAVRVLASLAAHKTNDPVTVLQVVLHSAGLAADDLLEYNQMGDYGAPVLSNVLGFSGRRARGSVTDGRPGLLDFSNAGGQ